MLLKSKEVSQIVVNPILPGSRAVYIIESKNSQDKKEIKELFGELSDICEVRQLSEGVVMAYAIQSTDQAVFSEVETALKRNFAFCILERSFNETIYGVIQDLCSGTGSRLCRMPRCGICGNLEPFPTRIRILDNNSDKVFEGSYCARCVAQQARTDDKKFIIDLLTADKRGFAEIRNAKLKKKPKTLRMKAVEPDSNTRAYAIAS